MRRRTCFLIFAATIAVASAFSGFGPTSAMAVAKQGCNDAAPTAEQAARRAQAVQFARTVNTAQSRTFAATRHYQQLFDGITTPAGFAAQLVTSDSGYMFKVRDTAAECGVILFSDQDGLIYTARPLQ
jgi:hypothetical protein